MCIHTVFQTHELLLTIRLARWKAMMPMGLSQGSALAPEKGLACEQVPQLADGVLKSLGLGAVVRIQVDWGLADFGSEARARVM